MFNIIKNISILILILLTITVVLYAKEEINSTETIIPGAEVEIEPVPDNISSDNASPQETLSADSKKDEYITFTNWINEEPCTVRIDEKKEKALLREGWRQMLGIDLFYPYFKAREITDKVEEKSSLTVLRVRGRARIKEDEAKYIFGVKF